eukprot:886390-Prymnesium_polylepis.1
MDIDRTNEKKTPAACDTPLRSRGRLQQRLRSGPNQPTAGVPRQLPQQVRNRPAPPAKASEVAFHHVRLVDHANKLAHVHDEDAIESELREVKVDERHRCLCLHSKRRDVEPELAPHVEPNLR